jgi:hypothetical protein
MTLSFSTQRAVDAATLAADATRILASFARAQAALDRFHRMDDATRQPLHAFGVKLHDQLSPRAAWAESNVFAGVALGVPETTHFLGALLYLVEAGGHPTVFLTIQDAAHIVAAKAFAAQMDATVDLFEVALIGG